MRAALLALVLLAGGCASPAAEIPPVGMVIECDRARVVVPAGESAAFDEAGEFTRGSVTIRTPAPTVVSGGEDFSVVAEGAVRILRWDGKRTFEEGPFRTVVIRNGNILRR